MKKTFSQEELETYGEFCRITGAVHDTGSVDNYDLYWNLNDNSEETMLIGLNTKEKKVTISIVDYKAKIKRERVSVKESTYDKADQIIGYSFRKNLKIETSF